MGANDWITTALVVQGLVKWAMVGYAAWGVWSLKRRIKMRRAGSKWRIAERREIDALLSEAGVA